MSNQSDRIGERLRLIAQALGVPVESFFADLPPRPSADTVEYLRLWGFLRTDAERAAVLDAVRDVLRARDR